jgi:hypothetical protein
MRISAEDRKWPAHEYAEDEINDGADAVVDRRPENKVGIRQRRLSDANAQRGIPIGNLARAETAELVKDVSADEEPYAQKRGRIGPESLCERFLLDDQIARE